MQLIQSLLFSSFQQNIRLFAQLLNSNNMFEHLITKIENILRFKYRLYVYTCMTYLPKRWAVNIGLKQDMAHALLSFYQLSFRFFCCLNKEWIKRRILRSRSSRSRGRRRTRRTRTRRKRRRRKKNKSGEAKAVKLETIANKNGHDLC